MDFNFEFFIILFDDSMKCVNIATGRHINKNKRRILFAELYVHLKRSPSGLSLGQMSPMPTLSIRFMVIRHYKQLNHHFNVFVIIRFVDVDFVILTIQCVCVCIWICLSVCAWDWVRMTLTECESKCSVRAVCPITNVWPSQCFTSSARLEILKRKSQVNTFFDCNEIDINVVSTLVNRIQNKQICVVVVVDTFSTVKASISLILPTLCRDRLNATICRKWWFNPCIISHVTAIRSSLLCVDV